MMRSREAPSNSKSDGAQRRRTSLDDLHVLAKRIRATCVRMAHEKRHGHLSSSLSVVDILVALYGGFLAFDANDPHAPDRDRLIFSKGHGCASLYATWVAFGLAPSEHLYRYADADSPFAIHPCRHALPLVEMSSGSLGHGVAFGAGKALALKNSESRARVVVIVGDGECNEGSIWEGAMFAAARHLDNLVVIVDENIVQAVGRSTVLTGHTSLVEKFQAFGWSAVGIDGNDLAAVRDTLDGLDLSTGKPNAIVARTRGGAGISFMEDDVLWHYRTPSQDDFERAMNEVDADPLHGRAEPVSASEAES